MSRPARSVAPSLAYCAYFTGTFLWLATLVLLVFAQPSRAAVTAKSRLSEPTWKKRYESISEEARKGEAEVVFLGDSITHGWKFVPEFQEHFGKYHALNAGISSDRVEHLLWRVRNGNFDKVKPKAAVILIGVNNLAVSTPDEITAGVREVLDEIHQRSPRTKVLVMGLFPTGKEKDHPRRAKVAAVNRKLATLAKTPWVDYLDIGDRLVEKDGSISKDMMFDYLHLTEQGYEIWAEALDERLTRMTRGA